MFNKKSIIAVFGGLFLAASASFALPSAINSKLSSSEKATLEKGQPVIRNLKSVKEFGLTVSSGPISDAQDVAKKLKPAYLAEVIQVLPYKGNENLINKISDMMMDIPSYAGIPYYSVQAEAWYDLYSSAVIKSSSTSGEDTVIKADLEMEPFGLIQTTINAKKKADSFYYVSTNNNTLKYNDKYTCVKPENMKSIVAVVRDGDNWILYGIGAVDAPSIFFLRERVERSFMNRIKTFCSHFFTKL